MNLSLLFLLTGCALGVLCTEPRLDDVSVEDEPNELDSTNYQPNRPHDGVHMALLAAMRRPGMRKKMGEIMPIIRVMSPPQRLTLAALLTSQMLSANAPTLGEVSAMFGVEPSAPDDVKRRVTSALLLPLSYDIARVLKGERTERAHTRPNTETKTGNSELVSDTEESRRFGRRPPAQNRRMSYVYADMVPPALPSKPAQAQRRSDGVQHVSNEKCLLFSNNVCLEVPDYPGAQIAASLRLASDSMEDVLMPENQDLQQTLGENRRQDVASTAMCESITKMARPKKARTTSGQWKFIVNTGRHTQTLRLEVCNKPESGCSYISDNFASECVQVYNYHRLLTWDEARGLHMDIFKVPTCCSCQVRGYANNFPPSGQDSHAFESHVPKRVAFPPGFHGDKNTFVVQGSPFQDTFEELPVDETELLKQGAVIEQQLLLQQQQQNQRRVQRRPPGLGDLPRGLQPPPGPPPGAPRPTYEFVDNNIRRSRNQTQPEPQYVGVSRPRPTEPPRTVPIVSSTPPPGSKPMNRNSPQFEPEPVKVNYSYHPIIDFFKSRKMESRSGEGWTPIVGRPGP